MPCEGVEAFDAVSICGSEPAATVEKKILCSKKPM